MLNQICKADEQEEAKTCEVSSPYEALLHGFLIIETESDLHQRGSMLVVLGSW